MALIILLGYIDSGELIHWRVRQPYNHNKLESTPRPKQYGATHICFFLKVIHNSLTFALLHHLRLLSLPLHTIVVILALAFGTSTKAWDPPHPSRSTAKLGSTMPSRQICACSNCLRSDTPSSRSSTLFTGCAFSPLVPPSCSDLRSLLPQVLNSDKLWFW